MKKFFSFLVTLFTVFSSIIISTTTLSATTNDSKELIIVEVIVGNPNDAQKIENIVLDDGTSLADHDYVVLNRGMFNSRSSSYAALGQYFDYAAWINRDGKISLSLKPKSNVKNTLSGLNAAWSKLANVSTGFGGDYRFRHNPSGLNDQYVCHYYFASFKEYWNLEPYAPNVGYWATVFASCNP